MLACKRVYDPPEDQDGLRVLVDRLWPRGLSREAARVDEWLKALAPSAELRRSFGHDPSQWESFKARYFEELHRPAQLEEARRLQQRASIQRVTLLFGARNRALNNAVALKEFLETAGADISE
ncbi:MAG: DUF488 family protein [Chloroflexi bacterium]|nr:DUF488 family protein [Chloroflexota bacterium]